MVIVLPRKACAGSDGRETWVRGPDMTAVRHEARDVAEVGPRSNGGRQRDQAAQGRSCTDRIRLEKTEHDHGWQFPQVRKLRYTHRVCKHFRIPCTLESAAIEAFQPMCGIAGIFRYRSERPIETTVIGEMAARLRHRGPDDQGTHIVGRIGLGHTRLSIIDLSPSGHQPFSDESGRFTLIYNGEIYNYKELRAWLEGRGHRFRSRTDTEVVLRSYIELGARCVERLIGMFAFAVW